MASYSRAIDAAEKRVLMPTSLATLRANAAAVDEVHSDFHVASLARLRRHAQIVRMGQRSIVSELGQSSIYVVAKGVAAVECAPSSSARTVVELLYPGDILAPQFQAPLPDLALIAKGPVEFWKLMQTSLSAEAERDGTIWQDIFVRLNAQAARSQLHIAATLGLTCEQRLAGFLIEIGCRLGVFRGGALSFELPLSRYSMGEYLSLNADTVSRVLSGMTADNIIARKGRFQISIMDWNALVAMCPLSEAIAKLHGANRSPLNS